MMPHIRTGAKGEELAAEWLTAEGFHILHRNWRHGRYEVDVIASKDDIIHFIEIKSRHPNAYGPPELSVTRKKIEHILQGAQGWLINHPGLLRIQYDVLAITLRPDAGPEYVLFKDVYL
ncbi:MAG TPA: YraN family protein [Puia sp.]|jgi:putative endonuclease|nr:YraN family protein [Puia sp.]